ncbi:HK97-gp10 family putative phage morphogenesis protein [Govanella unica]|uniref:Uncharacterized protein n=1 Tax=Govanella unica TaxID=2975056 RepID=A0A9X3U0L1_9PROT|nr:HK97-gp10 family putative phage morphogenesis protein [Govania unica]MDA5194948.1 hypothetical protein [Govania unica]
MISIDVTGVNPLLEGQEIIAARTALAIAAAAEAIAENARGRLNPGGNLADNILVETGDTETLVRAQTPYAVYVEFGTSRMEARPFLTPAIEDLRGRLGEILP